MTPERLAEIRKRKNKGLTQGIYAERAQLIAEVERVWAGIEALHQPASTDALMGEHAAESCDCEDECPTEPVQVCRECARIAEESDPHYGERGLSATLWPCATASLLNPPTEEPAP